MKTRPIDGIMCKQTRASHPSVSRIKVSELEGILPIETEGIESHTTLQRFADASHYMHTRTSHVT